MSFILIGIAGGVGAICRSLLHSWGNRKFTSFGTFLVNILGSLLFGVWLGLFPSITGPTPFTTGFLGGFTTFSTVSVEIVQLLTKKDWGVTSLFLLSSVLGSVLAVGAGFALSSLLHDNF
ncbi:fluoride efflux transporter FluC [Risungbinella massiliensis]|uniref:fluoride efflux transporter FluC n=1 Tax=Risungbinella massiliensis TaxID=1329796 RepID=UPI0005CC3C46|nr:CrcB family protein [Risungbinella massiliensis]